VPITGRPLVTPLVGRLAELHVDISHLFAVSADLHRHCCIGAPTPAVQLSGARYKLTSNSRLISAGERSTRCNIRTDNACSLSDDVSTSALATKLRATSVTTMSQKEVLEYCTYVSDSEKNSNSNRTVLRQSERLLHSQQRWQQIVLTSQITIYLT